MIRSTITAVLLAAMAAAAAPATAAPAEKPAAPAAYDQPAVVLEVIKSGGPNLLKPDGWRPYETGFTREDGGWLCDNAADARAARGLTQTIVLNQSAPAPIIASAWSKAEGVGGTADSDHSLYLDLIYTDGQPLWGQVAAFRTGTHDWQRAEVKVFPAKPVRSVTVNLLLRRHAGKAHFKEAQLSAVASGDGVAMFDGLPVRVRKDAPGSTWLVRDVAAGGDFCALRETRGVQVKDSAEGSAGLTPAKSESEIGLTDTTGKDRALTVVAVTHVDGSGWKWLGGPRRQEPAESPHEYASTTRAGNVGANGQLSRYPFAAVANDRGVAIGTDMLRPALFRTGFSAGTGLLYVAWDIALTREKPSAALNYVSWRFEANEGFRGALAGYYKLFPDQFKCRTPEQGIWMPFHEISKVRAWEDFGFKFKEGDNETAWDNAHGLLTFRYTEPMTWWMRMPKDMPRTYDAALAEAKRLAAGGSREAQALLASGYYDESGRLVGKFRNEPWCDGVVWSMNSAPGIGGAVTDFRNKWNPTLIDRLYPAQEQGAQGATGALPARVPGAGPAITSIAPPGPRPQPARGQLSGEYVDSSEGYVTDVLDFRRDHFAVMRTPLVFASDTFAPAVFRGLIAWEYCDAISRDVHARGRLMMVNGTPDRLPWLATLFDVLGTETDWNPGGVWRPMSGDEMMYRRIMCGPKPYCFLMNTSFDRFPYTLVEKYMKRCLAYGMFPGFFSADASTGHYFSRPEFYDRDRPLFKKYVPLARSVAEAGWQPITRARSSDPYVHVERFGERLLTVFNDSPIERKVTLTLDDPAPRKGRELVRAEDVAWPGGKASLTLGPEDVAVIEMEK